MWRSKGKRIILLTVILAAVCLLPPASRADKYITLTFTGDCTIGSEEKYRDKDDSFDAYVKREGYSYFFANFVDLFSRDDCTVINLEGVLYDSGYGEKTKKAYRFRGGTDFVKVLTAGSVELAGIANNHIADYGAKGMQSTIDTLEEAGIAWTRAMDCHIQEKDGIRVAIFAIDYSLHNTYKDILRKEIGRIKDSGEANAVILIYHNGNEYDARHMIRQTRTGDYYIDAGADLVIMHHSHAVQGIQIRNNRTILYSLGNFVFGGNRDIKTVDYKGIREVTSEYGLVAQVKLHFSNGGVYLGQQTILYPIYTSSAAPKNNFQPKRLTGEQAIPVIDAIRFDTPEEIEIPEAENDDSGYVRIVMPYLSSGAVTPVGPERRPDGIPEEPPGKPER